MIRVTIGSAFAVPEDSTRPVGEGQWTLLPRLTVALDRPCSDIKVIATAQAFFNGRPYPRGREVGGMTAGGSGKRFTTSFDALADAGSTVIVRARAACLSGKARGAHGDAERRFTIPTASCDGGPLRVLELRGTAALYDDQYQERWVPSQVGDLVPADFAIVRIAPRGRMTIGAPQCNGFFVRLFPGTSNVGGYNRGKYGNSFWAKRIFMRADGHAGPVSMPGPPGSRADHVISPVLLPCADCAGRTVSFAARADRGRLAVRVYRGAVDVARIPGRSVRVIAGFELLPPFVSTPRLFQPHEPWTRQPSRDLAPPFARRAERSIPSAGGEPAQRVVHWWRDVRTEGGTNAGRLTRQEGIIVWQHGGGQWRRRFSVGLSRFDGLASLVFADVTGDRHPDLLLAQIQGSGACGPRTVFATIGGRVRRVFHRDFCEGDIAAVRGRLTLTQPIGPCPFSRRAVHCFGGTKTTTFDWNGHRLVIDRVNVKCALARLDPRSGCAQRR